MYTIHSAKTDELLFGSSDQKDLKKEMIRQARYAIVLKKDGKKIGVYDWVNFKLTKIA